LQFNLTAYSTNGTRFLKEEIKAGDKMGGEGLY